uniref:Uncharacterized protein n=1 Tax=Symphyocladiella dendroidea TaxID=2506487 RepID=A0A1Z1M770_9FLOR|nr:hypothetical protein [Symphyocladiella dendroidea]ARW61800.1 hypothetical protein [Symphyocladiella dendroidea]
MRILPKYFLLVKYIITRLCITCKVFDKKNDLVH